MPSPPAADEVVVPALLRAARGAYGAAIRRRLADGGFDDMPRNGPFVLGGMANRGGSAGDLMRELGVTKQAASQLIDTLVLRGYLERRTNADDRRRMTIDLTERGRAAADAVGAGVEAVDAELAEMISPSELAGLRAGLVALTAIRERMEDEDRSQASPRSNASTSAARRLTAPGVDDQLLERVGVDQRQPDEHRREAVVMRLVKNASAPEASGASLSAKWPSASLVSGSASAIRRTSS